MAASIGVSAAAWAVLEVFAVPGDETLFALVFPAAYIAYSYSPLPQGPQPSNHRQRKPTWGFSPEYEDSPQTELSHYGDNDA